jgi:hypothetical protein
MEKQNSAIQKKEAGYRLRAVSRGEQEKGQKEE